MYVIMIIAAVEVVLLMIFGVVRMVLNERRQQRIQRGHAAAYFAARDLRHSGIEAINRESVR